MTYTETKCSENGTARRFVHPVFPSSFVLRFRTDLQLIKITVKSSDKEFTRAMTICSFNSSSYMYKGKVK